MSLKIVKDKSSKNFVEWRHYHDDDKIKSESTFLSKKAAKYLVAVIAFRERKGCKGSNIVEKLLLLLRTCFSVSFIISSLRAEAFVQFRRSHKKTNGAKVFVQTEEILVHRKLVINLKSYL